MKRTANSLGDNAGSSWTLPGSIPSGSSSAHVANFSYSSAGNLQGKTQTLPLFVYVKLEGGNPGAAIVLSLVLLAVSLAVLVGLRDRWLRAL